MDAGFEADKRQLGLIAAFGAWFRDVLITVDQEHLENRLLATDAVASMAAVPFPPLCPFPSSLALPLSPDPRAED